MRVVRLLLVCGLISSGLASCQTFRPALQARPFGQVVSFATDSTTTVLLLHDSQGPQATRVVLTQAEAATFRQQ